MSRKGGRREKLATELDIVVYLVGLGAGEVNGARDDAHRGQVVVTDTMLVANL